MDELLKLLHPVDALVHVVRNFDRSGKLEGKNYLVRDGDIVDIRFNI